jgi:hypothetical protein
VIDAGTDIVEFSPTGPFQETMAVISKNLAVLKTA